MNRGGLKPVTDRKIVERVLKGDVEAFNLLVRQWEKPIYNFIVRMIGDREEAMDLCQDAFMKAYRETIEYMYNDPAALKVYADFVGISDAKAKRTRDDFFPKQAVDPDRIVGLDAIMKDAVELKFTSAPLTKEQLSELVQIPPR